MLNVLISIVVLCPICTVCAQAADTDIRQELNEIKKTQQAIQKDLTEIKALLSRITAQQQPPLQTNIKGTEFDIGENPVFGSESAKFILVEFTDYQCPFCCRYVRETFPFIRYELG